MNSQYGGPSQLPFDLRNRRVLTYDPARNQPKIDVRRQLLAQLQHSIRLLLETIKGTKTPLNLQRIETAVSESMDHVEAWLPIAESPHYAAIVSDIQQPHLASPLLGVAMVDASSISTDLYNALSLAHRYLSEVDEQVDSMNRVDFTQKWMHSSNALNAAENAQYHLGEASRLIGGLKTGG